MLNRVKDFTSKPVADASKLRGGYYTPTEIARFVAAWVSATGARVLEPSCGDGSILRFLPSGSLNGRPQGVELVPEEALLASQYGAVVNDDFFHWMESDGGNWDGVAGNPPYIRFGNWDDQFRRGALDLMRREGLHPSRLTNAWVPFVVGATVSTKQAGRVGLVLPAELLQVGYAAELRRYIVERYSEVTLVTFRRLVFDGILQEVVLFLGTVGRGPARMRVVHAEDTRSLADLELEGPSAPALFHDEEKWTKYFLKPTQIKTLRDVRSSSDLRSLSSYADVQVGIVTGRNSFFTMTRTEAEDRGLLQHCVPLVARTSQLPGLRYSELDMKSQYEDDVRALLLRAPKELDGLDALETYVRHGEAQGVHQGYKCSIRSPWWTTPSFWVPDAFMYRQIHTHPRIVVNETAATATDTIHRVRLTAQVSSKSLAAAAFNSATFAFSEIQGRSYGGGIHELEPSEAAALLVVDPHLVPETLPESIDLKLRAGDLEGAVELADATLLVEGLGWSDRKVKTVRSAWLDLRARRAGRGRR
ncbi:class I SAM-dependent methyltransferase [Kineosporia sp. A_224]|uniref:Eco57I restriction-modification methylase domain-containing protein n=1 Tax=Kineosporia sp. A_224 TaxID=1962180 RepID=UPI000B4C1733